MDRIAVCGTVDPSSILGGCTSMPILPPISYKDRIFTSDEVRGKDFEDVTFTKCTFSGTQLRFTSFTHCKFDTCDLSGSFLDSTHFSHCSFPGSRLSFLDFATATLKECNFTHTIMNECIFQQLKDGSKSEQKKFDLQGCTFEQANLSGSIFVFCVLTSVSFASSSLNKAVFERCKMRDTNLAGCELVGANFDTSTVQNAVLDINGFITYGNSKGFVLK